MITARSEGLHRQKYEIGESLCTIITDKPEALRAAESSIRTHRAALKEYIRKFPSFQTTLEPFDMEEGPEVARLMAESSSRAGVGPMAAVAGVLADLAVKAMLKTGARVAVVENGGEASFVLDRPVDIAVQAGDTPLSRRMGFRLEEFPVGVATSSGLFSHALSFGEAEAATVFAKDAGIADAAATAVANAVIGEDEEKVIEEAVELGLAIEGVHGVFTIYRGYVGLGGKVPTIIGVNPRENGTPAWEV